MTAPDQRALIVAQGTTGQLWRFDLDDASVTPVNTRGVDLTNADGLVRRGGKLTVVRNLSRVVTTLASRRRWILNPGSSPSEPATRTVC